MNSDFPISINKRYFPISISVLVSLILFSLIFRFAFNGSPHPEFEKLVSTPFTFLQLLTYLFSPQELRLIIYIILVVILILISFFMYLLWCQIGSLTTFYKTFMVRILDQKKEGQMVFGFSHGWIPDKANK